MTVKVTIQGFYDSDTDTVTFSSDHSYVTVANSGLNRGEDFQNCGYEAAKMMEESNVNDTFIDLLHSLAEHAGLLVEEET